MFDSFQDRIRRSLAPQLVVAASRRRLQQRMAASLARGFSQPLRIELYFAFDDAYAAIAVPGVLDIASRYPVEVLLYPILSRGILDDPAADVRLRHSVKDANLLAARKGRHLARTTPLAASDCSFLATWLEAARGIPAANAFAAAAMEELWFNSSRAIPRTTCAALYRSMIGCEPPNEHTSLALALDDNARRLQRKGHWESPALNIGGEWFFAHERLGEIEARLDQLRGARR